MRRSSYLRDGGGTKPRTLGDPLISNATQQIILQFSHTFLNLSCYSKERLRAAAGLINVHTLPPVPRKTMTKHDHHHDCEDFTFRTFEDLVTRKG